MAKKAIPSIHASIQEKDGSVAWVWYLFFQWIAENAGKIDLSDYFTKEETEALLELKANTADLSTVAFTGDYDDLSDKPDIPAPQIQSDWAQADTSAVDYIKNKPTIPAAQVQADWTQTDTSAVDYIKNKPVLATVATSGSYNDLSNRPTIPTVGDGTITLKQGGVTKGTFTTNQSGNTTIDLDAGGSVAIDETTIVFNSDDEIQAVAVVDQNTGIVKTWTGTAAEYDAIVTKDPDTEYIITDDVGGSATAIGQITEALNDKVDKGHQVVEFQEPTSANNYTWYRKYADGWVEQGGVTNADTATAGTVVLPVAMANTKYTVVVGNGNTTTNMDYTAWCGATGRTTTGFVIMVKGYGGSGTSYDCCWQVSGMVA